MVLRPSKFNFREMRKVSVQEKYRHVNEDVSQAFELFWFGTHERENEFIAYLYYYTICTNIHLRLIPGISFTVY